jgi:hypothetical protein
LVNNVNWLTESIVTRYPSSVRVTDTEAITVSLLCPDSAYAAKTSRALVCSGMEQGESVQTNSSVFTNPRMTTETLVGREEKARRITYGCATGPIGASIKAYRPEGSTLAEVGRLISGALVEVWKGGVAA